MLVTAGASSSGNRVPAATTISERVGTVYEVVLDTRTSATSSSGSTSSSNDRDALTERILRIGNDGVDLEYDLPENASAQDRLRTWQFPVRVFRPAIGHARLLNRDDLAKRFVLWLKMAKLSPAACGHWVFTWTAIKIECDADAALEVVAAYDLRPGELHDGFLYHDHEGSGSATMHRVVATTGSVSFIGSVPVDPDRVRREHARSDFIVAEITSKPLTMADAISARSGEKVSGSIAITFEVDATGFVRQRTRVSQLETGRPDGEVEHRTTTELLTRRATP